MAPGPILVMVQTLSYEWKSTCPFAEFDDSTSVNPLLAFAPYDNNENPASCEVQLTVTSSSGSVDCSSKVAVGECAPQCQEINVASELEKLISISKEQSKALRTEVRSILSGYSCGKTSRVKKFARETILEGRRLRKSMLEFLELVPLIVQYCPENSLCVHTDTTAAYLELQASSAAFIELMRQTIRTERRCLDGGECNGSVTQCKRRVVQRRR